MAGGRHAPGCLAPRGLAVRASKPAQNLGLLLPRVLRLAELGHFLAVMSLPLGRLARLAVRKAKWRWLRAACGGVN